MGAILDYFETDHFISSFWAEDFNVIIFSTKLINQIWNGPCVFLCQKYAL
jgi:hypothetical protein